MKVTINKSELKGRVRIPPSKSYTIRGLMCAALAKGESQIVHPLLSDDTEAAADVLGKVGVDIQREDDLWRISGGHFHQPHADLYCGDSAATLRFMTAICSIIPGESRLTAGPSLSQRPIGPLIRALKKLGVDCSSESGLPPVTVVGGRLKGRETEIPGNISSQYISALLMISPFAEKGVKIRLTKPLESKSYVMMTLLCLRTFGIKVAKLLDSFGVDRQVYQPGRYEIEGDWSSASYFMALGATSGELEIENLNSASWQGDRIILDFLREMGASIRVTGDAIVVGKSDLKAIKADLSECIDLLPTMAVLAALANGTSEFTGIARARIKESDRVSALREGLESMGIEVQEDEDKLTVVGSAPKGAAVNSEEEVQEDEDKKAVVGSTLHGAVINSGGDHRIAMAFSILGAVAGETVIDGAECVSKTYPKFWDALKNVGGEVRMDDE